MEFSSRGFQRNSNARPAQDNPVVFGGSTPTPNEPKPNGGGKFQTALKTVRGNKFVHGLNLSLATSILILFIAIVLGISLYANSKESAAVNNDGYQVVALADGQAYFGKITSINDASIILGDVFYLNSQSETEGTSSNSIQLVKRGCEVHGPSNQMVIYRGQVNFWENLQTDGRVAKGIEQWKTQNPEGQNCDDQTAAPTQQPTSSTPTTENTNDTTTTSTNQDTAERTAPSTQQTPTTNNSSDTGADDNPTDPTAEPANP